MDMQAGFRRSTPLKSFGGRLARTCLDASICDSKKYSGCFDGGSGREWSLEALS